MKKLRVTRLKISSNLSARLSELGLSASDLDYLLCFGRKLNRAGLTIYFLDPMLAPGSDEQLARLTGIALTVSRDGIIDIRSDYDQLSTSEESEPLTPPPEQA